MHRAWGGGALGPPVDSHHPPCGKLRPNRPRQFCLLPANPSLGCHGLHKELPGICGAGSGAGGWLGFWRGRGGGEGEPVEGGARSGHAEPLED